jgi:hypothetical protein
MAAVAKPSGVPLVHVLLPSPRQALLPDGGAPADLGLLLSRPPVKSGSSSVHAVGGSSPATMHIADANLTAPRLRLLTSTSDQFVESGRAEDGTPIAAAARPSVSPVGTKVRSGGQRASSPSHARRAPSTKGERAVATPPSFVPPVVFRMHVATGAAAGVACTVAAPATPAALNASVSLTSTMSMRASAASHPKSPRKLRGSGAPPASVPVESAVALGDEELVITAAAADVDAFADVSRCFVRTAAGQVTVRLPVRLVAGTRLPRDAARSLRLAVLPVDAARGFGAPVVLRAASAADLRAVADLVFDAVHRYRRAAAFDAAQLDIRSTHAACGGR